MVERPNDELDSGWRDRPTGGSRGGAAATVVLAGILGWVVLTLDDVSGGVTELALAELDRSGVEHPVTAVLLNFRSYDTWLELVVLLTGLLGVFAMRGRPWRTAESLPRGGPLLTGLVRVLVPLMVLVGGYLLWLGKTAAGGAFQAGVVWGVALVLLWYGGFPSVRKMPRAVTVPALLVGIAAFIALAGSSLAGGGSILQLPPDHASVIILLVESAATVSIGLAAAYLIIALQRAEGA